MPEVQDVTTGIAALNCRTKTAGREFVGLKMQQLRHGLENVDIERATRQPSTCWCNCMQL